MATKTFSFLKMFKPKREQTINIAGNKWPVTYWRCKLCGNVMWLTHNEKPSYCVNCRAPNITGRILEEVGRPRKFKAKIFVNNKEKKKAKK